jgi:hypothetical protein
MVLINFGSLPYWLAQDPPEGKVTTSALGFILNRDYVYEATSWTTVDVIARRI